MNLWEALQQGRRLLSQVSEEAELDAELLLRHCLKLDRAGTYRRLDKELSAEQEQCYRELVGRRLTHEPTMYILGHKEFFGLDFEVTPAAIIPRPETELLVEIGIDFLHSLAFPGGATAVDVGAGCGVIAVSVAHAIPNARVLATDISARALALAGRNADRHQVHERVHLVRGELLGPLGTRVQLIAANLPYVRTADWERMAPEIREHEPRDGLDGGRDGLQAIGQLLEQAPSCLAPGGLLLAEIGDGQGKAAALLARKAFAGATIDVRADLAGRDRVLVVRT